MKFQKALMFLLVTGFIGSISLAATVQGKIIDENGNPIPEITVKLSSGLLADKTVVSDKDGNYKFEILMTGDYVLGTTSDKFDSIAIKFRLADNEEVATYEVYTWKKPQISNKIMEAYQDAFRMFNQMQYEEALTKINELIKENPGISYFHSLKGGILNALGRMEEAMPEYEKAIEINPYDIPSNNSLAEYYSLQQKHLKALDYLLRVAKAEPTDPEVSIAIGQAYMKAKKLETSFEYFEKAIKYDDPNGTGSAEAYWWLGGRDIQNKEYAKAKEKFEKFVQLVPYHQYADNARMFIKKIGEILEKENK